MNKTTQTILIVAAIAAAGGVAYYLYNKNKAPNYSAPAVTGIATQPNPAPGAATTPAATPSKGTDYGAIISGVSSAWDSIDNLWE